MKAFYLGMFAVVSARSVAGGADAQIEKAMIVEPRTSSWEAFPESTASAEGILAIKADASELSSKLHANVLYTTKSGVPAPPAHH